jgi:hypothetical protein
VVKEVQHGLLREPDFRKEEFLTQLSKKVLDGWEIVSSGYNDGCWWAIVERVEF